jgi:hypothetical protein
MKKIKANKENHVSNSKIGMGDHYGSGVKNPVGTIRDVMGMGNNKPKRLGKPPRSLA